MKTTADILPEGKRRGNAGKVRLHEAWQALSEGRGGQEDWDLAFGDLAEQSGYYFIAPEGCSNEELQRREGARALFARILFLIDVPVAQLKVWRAAALVELGITDVEGDR